MAKFKKGDRVKRIAGHPNACYSACPVGTECVVIGPFKLVGHSGETMYDVSYGNDSVLWNCLESTLVPILDEDEKAKEFIAAIKGLRPLSVYVSKDILESRKEKQHS